MVVDTEQERETSGERGWEKEDQEEGEREREHFPFLILIWLSLFFVSMAVMQSVSSAQCGCVKPHH